jgi:hypothetical protein
MRYITPKDKETWEDPEVDRKTSFEISDIGIWFIAYLSVGK